MASKIFTQGGGGGIGSYVVVFKNGRMAEDTDLRKLKGAYDAGDQIYVSIVDDEIEQALSTLPPRDAKVLRLYFGLEGGREHTLEEIGSTRFELSDPRPLTLKGVDGTVEARSVTWR